MAILCEAIITVSLITAVLAEVRFLAVVLRSSTLWFLFCLFVPLGDLVYLALYPRFTWRPLLLGYSMVLLGLIVALMSAVAGT